MTTLSNIRSKQDSLFFFAGWLCLLVVAAVDFLLMVKGEAAYTNLISLVRLGIGGSLVVFWGISLARCPQRMLRWDILLGIMTVVWFLALAIFRKIHHLPGQSIPLFLPVYLIALPFAAAAEDTHRQAGIRTVAMVYLAAAAYLMTLVLHLFVTGEAPASLQQLVYWRENRVQIIHHPNALARILMIAICLNLGFLERVKGFLLRGLLLGFTGLLFFGVALTNSRAAVLAVCLLLGGNLFFRIWKGGFKRLIAALAAAALVAGAAFLASDGLFQWNSDRRLSAAAASEPMLLANVQPQDTRITDLSASDSQTPVLTEVTPPPASQGSWTDDLPTLNNRTLIWAGALKKIQDDPWILLRGDTDTHITLEFFTASHSHNAWMETLLRLGLPGLLISLVFTWWAGWSSLRVLLHSGAGMWKKNIAMLVLAMMVTSFLEPFLFVTTTTSHFFDTIFFLCLGYLNLWSRELREQR